MMQPEWVVTTQRVIQVFDRLGITYFIGGSVASMIHGVTRATLDADFVCDVRVEHIEPLVSELEADFYIEPEQIRDAINRKTSFNLIHQESMFKIDVFIPKTRQFEQLQLARRVEVTIGQPESKAWVASVEDTVLAKLDWFRQGGETSERQWRDVLGVLKTKSAHLDTDYLQETAKLLGIDDLVETAIKEASIKA